jgi:hypothetical protein
VAPGAGWFPVSLIAGHYESKPGYDRDYRKIQPLTIQGLLKSKERLDAPPRMNPFAEAQREAKPEQQRDLILALLLSLEPDFCVCTIGHDTITF